MSPAAAARDRFAPAFLALYALSYMPMALFGTFMPVFLGSRGLSQAAIGAVMSVSPFVAMVAQPFWGVAADRAPSRNVVLMILLAGSGLSILLFLVSSTFTAIFAVAVVFVFFQMSVSPVQDAMTLQHLEATGGGFGPVRVAGTIGYAAIAAVGGMILERDLRLQFPLSALMYLGACAFVLGLPASRGAPSRTARPPVTSLLRNGELLLLLSFVTVIAATTFYYFVFFPVYFLDLGGTRSLLGWSTLVATIPEILVLLLADRLVRRVKIQWIVCGVGLLTAVRWLLFSFIKDPLLMIPVQAIHGLTFILMLFAVAKHVSAVVLPELKASGQALSGFLVAGVGRIIGGLVGGLAGQQLGIRRMFLVNGVITLLAVAVFGALYAGKAVRARRTAAS